MNYIYTYNIVFDQYKRNWTKQRKLMLYFDEINYIFQ